MNKIINFNISVHMRCLNAFWKKKYYYTDYFWFIAKKRYDILNHIILRCNSIIFI